MAFTQSAPVSRRTSRSVSPDSKAAPAPSVFFDLDGTIVTTEMPYVCYAFVFGLPNVFQRWLKLMLSLPLGLLTIICSLIDPALCIKILGWLATFGVSVKDAEISSNSTVLAACRDVVRPAMLAEIRRHQAAGRTVAILTGSLEVIVGPYCRSLGCVCIGTKSVLDKTGSYYTGEISEPNIGAQKIAHVANSGHPMEDLFGYGNSKSDIPFLCLTGNPHAVAPDTKLRRHSSDNAWNTSFMHLAAHSKE